MPLLKTAAVFTSGALIASAFALTGLQPWSVGAAPGDVDSTYVPIAPCRIIDTRPAPETVGPRTAPIGPQETYPIQITGSQGDCVGIPADASAVAMNVTVLDGTAPSFLTVFPSDLATPPKAANLNWLPGAPPTPNKVDAKLSPDGKVSVFNAYGFVVVIADVAGYYTQSSLSDLQTRVAALETSGVSAALEGRISTAEGKITAVETDIAVLPAHGTRLTAVEATVATVPGAIRDAQPDSLRYEGSDRGISSAWTNVMSTPSIALSRDGTVLVFASMTAVEFEAGADVQCIITEATTGFSANNNMRWEAAGSANSDEGDASNLAGMESFDAVGGTSGRYYLMCRVLSDTDGAVAWSPQLTVLFIRDR